MIFLTSTDPPPYKSVLRQSVHVLVHDLGEHTLNRALQSKQRIPTDTRFACADLMPVNSPATNDASGAGVLLTLACPAGDYTDADSARLLARLRELTDEVDIRSVFRGPNGVRVLIRSGAGGGEQLQRELLRGALRSFGVTQARLVELVEWEEEIELVQRMLQKDEDALRAVIAHFGGRIAGSLVRRFGDVIQESDVEMALNGAAWKLWRSANKFDPDLGSLGTWFYRIAEREVFDCIRSHGAGDVALEFEPGQAGRTPWGSTSHRANRALIADLDAVIDLLPTMQRTIILADLAAGERADDEKLALRLQTTVNSVRVSRNKAKKRIHEELRKRGHHDLDKQGADQ